MGFDIDLTILQWQGVTDTDQGRCAVGVFVYLHPDYASEYTHYLIECIRIEGDVELFYLFFRELCQRLTHSGDGRILLCRNEELEVFHG